MGTYIRHGVAALVGALVGALVARLTGWGLVLDPDQVATFVDQLTSALVMGVTLFGYAAVEKFLKRFPWLDLKGYIDRAWLKKEAKQAQASGLASVPRP